ncbi:hypothetical protein ACFLIM_39065 [Nonomuraea sp. M3C6]|uniref:Ryanodine receptor Ryr domain-containing protein n=1 Tax=Nonomuraea marmarensis TaxID=3351344 RepID=A0ABW7AT08_9ACTN
MAVELAEVEQARESVEERLPHAESLEPAEVDELVKRAAEWGWHLGKLGWGVPPDVVVDRSGERPVVRPPMEESFKNLVRLSKQWRQAADDTWYLDPRRPAQ